MQSDLLEDVPRAAMLSPIARGYTLREHAFAVEIERLRDKMERLEGENYHLRRYVSTASFDVEPDGGMGWCVQMNGLGLARVESHKMARRIADSLQEVYRHAATKPAPGAAAPEPPEAVALRNALAITESLIQAMDNGHSSIASVTVRYLRDLLRAATKPATGDSAPEPPLTKERVDAIYEARDLRWERDRLRSALKEACTALRGHGVKSPGALRAMQALAEYDGDVEPADAGEVGDGR